MQQGVSSFSPNDESTEYGDKNDDAMHTWYHYWTTIDTSTMEGERKLIVGFVPEASASTFPPQEVVILNRISLQLLKARFPRASLVRSMTRLKELDLVLSRAACLAPSAFLIHANRYGTDEYAHAPADGSESYISLNVAQRRVRNILSDGLRLGSWVSTSALADLLVHEKAHLSLLLQDIASKDHQEGYYKEKERLKVLLVKALLEKHKRDPFRRNTYESLDLLTPEELRKSFPTYILEKPMNPDGPDTDKNNGGAT